MTYILPQFEDIENPETYAIKLGEVNISWHFQQNRSRTVRLTLAFEKKTQFWPWPCTGFLDLVILPYVTVISNFQRMCKKGVPYGICHIWRCCAPPFLCYPRKPSGGWQPLLPGSVSWVRWSGQMSKLYILYLFAWLARESNRWIFGELSNA